jgi:hypothetical protein
VDCWYFVREVTGHLYRCTGPGEVARWVRKRRAWTPVSDPDGCWLWRAWGFGGYTDLSSVTEQKARQGCPEAFPHPR